MKSHLIKYIVLAATLLAGSTGADARRCDAGTLSALNAASRSRSPLELTVVVTGDIAAVAALPGVEVLATAGDAAVVRGTADVLTALADRDIVESMSISRRHSVTNDVSMAAICADAIHRGDALPRPFDGSGVVCGIFDIGVDPTHINFLDADGATRVRRIFHYTADDGTVEEYSTPDAIAAFTTDDPEETHGTHTLGTMAGSYCGPGTDCEGTIAIPYGGAAPGATAAIGCGELYDANICAGVAAIMEYAAAENRPCVVNLSLGEVLGPRDGTDPETRFLDNLTGPGRIIVLAAGNDGMEQRTFTRTFTDNLQDYRTFIRPWAVDERVEGVLDLWANSGAEPEVELVVANYWTGEIFGRATFGDSEESFALASGGAAQDGDRSFAPFNANFVDSRIGMTRSDNEGSNGRRNFWIEFSLQASVANTDMDISIAVFVHDRPGNRIDGGMQATNCRLHAGWLNGRDGYESPIGRMSISSLACGPNLISVGSWTARNTLRLLDGSDYETGLGNTPGGVSAFSSYGTLVDGRSLPLICAPGEAVVSSYSRYCTDAAGSAVAAADGMLWGYNSGTSMATPAVAGGIALWLEACADLTPAEVSDIIKSTALPFDGKADPRHGAGKFDAEAGLQEVLRRHAGIVSTIVPDNGRLVVTCRDGVITVVTERGTLGTVCLSDIAGRTVAATTSDTNSAEIEIPDLRPGIYIVSCGAGSCKIAVASNL